MESIFSCGTTCVR